MSYLKDKILKEKEEWILWLPFALAGGIAFYFLLPIEPPLWLGWLFVLISLGFTYIFSSNGEKVFLCLFLISFTFGFALVGTRAHLLSAPVLEKKTFAVMVEGYVESTFIAGKGQKIIIESPSIEGFMRKDTPKKVRIKVNGLKTRIDEGDKVKLKAVLMPPPMPSEPHAYNLPRKFWFEELGGVGFAVSKVEILEKSASFSSWLGRIRNEINFKIMDILPRDTAGVAMSLVTGEQGGNTKEISESYRMSGIAHMLSVSGLHMSMLAGIVFGFLRFFLALFPFIALRFNIKKISAFMAIIISFIYLLISGMAIPAERAFIMVLVVLLAIIFDREAISMRTITFALFTILIISPESLMGASLQMSFAAVYAIIAAYEIGKIKFFLKHKKKEGSKRGILFICFVWIMGILITDFVASSATTPFVLYHFDQIAVYSMLCNLLTGPILGIFVMPLLLIFGMLYPFGLGDFVLKLAGYGIDLINQTAIWIAELPGSVAFFPAMPSFGFFLCIIGGCWLCLWKSNLRLLGFIPLCLGLISPIFHKTPDILISQGGKLIAIADDKDKLLIEPGRSNRIVRESWLRRNGENYMHYDKQRAKLAWTEGFKGEGLSFKCDENLCLYERNGKKVGIAKTYDGLKKVCNNKELDLVISKVNAKKEYCKVGKLIERKELWKKGAFAIWLDLGDDIKILNDSEVMGNRLWTP